MSERSSVPAREARRCPEWCEKEAGHTGYCTRSVAGRSSVPAPEARQALTEYAAQAAEAAEELGWSEGTPREYEGFIAGWLTCWKREVLGRGGAA